MTIGSLLTLGPCVLGLLAVFAWAAFPARFERTVAAVVAAVRDELDNTDDDDPEGVESWLTRTRP